MIATNEDVIKLVLAVLIGGVIGVERELHHKAAGLRTIILICVGSALFTIISLRTGSGDRIASNIVTGVGFIGGGVILRDSGRVAGLTTASTIWLAAALGMGVGGGHYVITAATAAVGTVVLWVFPYFDRWINRAREVRTYEVVCPISREKSERLKTLVHRCGLRISRHRQAKRADALIFTWEVYGSSGNQDRFVEELLADAEVREFHFQG